METGSLKIGKHSRVTSRVPGLEMLQSEGNRTLGIECGISHNNTSGSPLKVFLDRKVKNGEPVSLAFRHFLPKPNVSTD